MLRHAFFMPSVWHSWVQVVSIGRRRAAGHLGLPCQAQRIWSRVRQRCRAAHFRAWILAFWLTGETKPFFKDPGDYFERHFLPSKQAMSTVYRWLITVARAGATLKVWHLKLCAFWHSSASRAECNSVCMMQLCTVPVYVYRYYNSKASKSYSVVTNFDRTKHMAVDGMLPCGVSNSHRFRRNRMRSCSLWKSTISAWLRGRIAGLKWFPEASWTWSAHRCSIQRPQFLCCVLCHLLGLDLH